MLERKRTRLSLTEKDDIGGRLEGGAVHACDWARLWQATSHHSQAVVATRGHRSPCASSLAASTHPRGARRHFARDRFRIVDSRDCPWSESCHLDGEPRNRTSWRPSRLSCPWCGRTSLAVGFATQALPAGHEPQVAEHRCE